MAILAGAVTVLILVVVGRKLQPPVYPVARLEPFSTEAEQAFLDDSMRPAIPDQIPATIGTSLLIQWDVAGWIHALPLSEENRASLLKRTQADPVDRLVPALTALARRSTLIDDAVPPLEEIKAFLARFPSSGDGPNCSATRPLIPFESYVCAQERAFNRTAMQRILFTTFYESERNRHQYGLLWQWALWRKQQHRQATLIILDGMETSRVEALPFIQNMNELTGPTDIQSPRGIRAPAIPPPATAEANRLAALLSGDLQSQATLAQRISPRITASCGVSANNKAQIQFAAATVEDPYYLPACLADLAKRATREQELQQKLERLLELRETALTHKNLLQVFSWWNQWVAQAEVEDLFDEVLQLSLHASPSLTLMMVRGDPGNEQAEHLLTSLTTSPLPTSSKHLFALATAPAVSQTLPSFTVTREHGESKGSTTIRLQTAGHPNPVLVYKKGNVLYVENASEDPLRFNVAKVANPALWTQCMELAQKEQSATWCTEHHWLQLSAHTPFPGSIYQLTRALIPASGTTRVRLQPPGGLWFWGTGVSHMENRTTESSLMGSAPVTAFEFVTDSTINPASKQWSFPSLLLELQ
jgi:hypothetical protein